MRDVPAAPEVARRLADALEQAAVPLPPLTYVYKETYTEDMDKVLSVRVDESAIDELDRAARRLGLSKKRLVEEAIRLRVAEAKQDEETDVWAETCGAWKRREAPTRTIRRARRAFTAAVTRHRPHRKR